MKIVKFKSWKCFLVRSRYRINNRVSLQLIDANDSEPVATATVNVVDVELKEKEVLIKDTSENEGMVDALIKAKVIHPEILGMVQTGYVFATKCKLI